MKTALENGLESVAFCCISTGVFHFLPELAARIAVETVKNFLDEHKDSSVKKVVFNVFSNKDLEIYKKVLTEIFPSDTARPTAKERMPFST